MGIPAGMEYCTSLPPSTVERPWLQAEAPWLCETVHNAKPFWHMAEQPDADEFSGGGALPAPPAPLPAPAELDEGDGVDAPEGGRRKRRRRTTPVLESWGGLNALVLCSCVRAPDGLIADTYKREFGPATASAMALTHWSIDRGDMVDMDHSGWRDMAPREP